MARRPAMTNEELNEGAARALRAQGWVAFKPNAVLDRESVAMLRQGGVTVDPACVEAEPEHDYENCPCEWCEASRRLKPRAALEAGDG